MKKKKIYIILVIIVLCILILVFGFSNNKKDVISEEEKIQNELIKYAKMIDKKYSITVFFSDSNDDFAIYNLKTIRNLTGDKLKKLSMCDEESTYVEIYVNRKGDERYKVVLDCDFEQE